MSWAIFAKASEILDYLKTTINTNVGSDMDASSPTGSVHAKLKDLKQSITPEFYTPNVAFVTRNNTGTTAWITLVDITGAGMVTEAVGFLRDSSFGYNVNKYCGYRITIDGVIVMSGRIGGTSQNWTTVGYDYLLSGFSQRSYINAGILNGADNRAFKILDLLSFPTLSSRQIIQQYKTYPSVENTSTASAGVTFLYSPIPFNTSFKIEVTDETVYHPYFQYSIGLL